jgi:bifunctional non-homologous end joining protein LigD
MHETNQRKSGEMAPLEEYRRKRAADRTPEPFGIAGRLSRSGGGMFVVQEHAARRLHYDFRLEMDGVLRSWAVPKGPSLNPADKRLAVMVEDHPLEYADFEGSIPAGNYGAGAVIVWDRGEYRAIDPPNDAPGGVRAGKLDIEMRGFKLQGAYTMVRTSGRNPRARESRPQWLLIKKRDEFAAVDGDILERRPRSVLSGLSLNEMQKGDRRAVEISAELERLRAPRLKAPIEPRSFTLALAKLVRRPVEGEEWLHEIKYDGVRALALRDSASARIVGRSGTEVTGNYPEVALALSKLPFARFVMDGEIVSLDLDGRPNFQLLQRRIQTHDPDTIARFALAAPVYYHAFDLLAFEHFDLRPLDLETRKALLRRMLADEGPLRYVDHHRGDGRDFLKAVEQAGLEGVVAKLRRSPYPVGRSGAWVKIKCSSVTRCVVGGWTNPDGARSHFGALLLGQYEAPGTLRFVGRVGTGFNEDTLRSIAKKLGDRETRTSAFRRARDAEATAPRGSHFCEPAFVCEVRFSEWTEEGVLRHPSFLRMIDGADPAQCAYAGAGSASANAGHDDDAASPDPPKAVAGDAHRLDQSIAPNSASLSHDAADRKVAITHADKIFWPAERYTKGDLVAYYRTIAPWILPYLRDRPVMLTRYPDGIDGKSFFQKDAPAYAPSWIRREQIYSEDSKREIAYFVLDSAEALAYAANMGSIPIHIWSSRVPTLGNPDWLLFDIDPKGSTTEKAVLVAQEVGEVLRRAGMRPCVKTSGQKGIHVVVGLAPRYTYEQARMFSELVARVVLARRPAETTLARNPSARGGRVYIDYIQLGEGKTIAAPFSVRPQPGAPASAPLKWRELRVGLDPVEFNIRTMPQRMERLGADPFVGVLEDRQEIEPALPKIESMLDRSFRDAAHPRSKP